MTKTIEIIISPAGEVEIKTSGFAGQSCKQATAELEARLGKVTKDTPTSEAYNNGTNTVVGQR